jgi:SAM-dependent methyltransferase
MTSSRLIAEREHHDRQAAERWETLTRDDLRFADAAFLDHETWVRPAVAAMGPLRGRAVLDYGCGHGMAAVVFARAGATVTAFDLSPGYVAEAEARAKTNGVAVRFAVADAEELPFADASFDAVWGNAILHHLDLRRAGAELYRVLKPDGVAVFCEPWGGNPLLSFARRWLPYPGKDRTPDERPLVKADLSPLREFFPTLTFEGHQLFAMVARAVRSRTVSRCLGVVDRGFLAVVPPLRNWCRYATVKLTKIVITPN